MMKRLLLAIALLGAGPAVAQQTLLQGGSYTAGHVPMYLQSGTSQPVVGDSGTAAGGGAGVGLSELGLTVRGTGTGPYANAGTGPLGTNLCDRDGLTTAAAGYHYLCFSPNAQGGGLIAYGAGGAASALPLQFSINGSLYEFPISLSGVLGPVSSAVGDVALWNNTSGSLLKDASGSQGTWPFTFPNSFGATPTDVFSLNIGSYPASAEIPAGVIQGIVGKVVVPGTYASEPWPNSAVAGYALSSNTAVGNSHMAFYGFAGVKVNGANPWGANLVVSNCDIIVCTTGTGLDGSLTGLEIDVNEMTKSGAGTPTGGVRGIEITGGSNIIPSANAVGVNIDAFGPGLPWGAAFVTTDGAAATALNIGATASGNGVDSQTIILHSRTSGASTIIGEIYLDQNGLLNLVPDTANPAVTIGNGSSLGKISTTAGNLVVNANANSGTVGLAGTTIASSAAQLIPTGSSVNYWRLQGAATGNAPSLKCAGTDVAINCVIASQGGGAIFLDTEGGAAHQVKVIDTSSPANQLTLTGGTNPEMNTTGGGLTLGSTSGVTTLIDTSVVFSGTPNFGTYTGSTCSNAGYITIKDAGGTNRKLMVCS